jgi:hypothetical protein
MNELNFDEGETRAIRDEPLAPLAALPADLTFSPTTISALSRRENTSLKQFLFIKNCP